VMLQPRIIPLAIDDVGHAAALESQTAVLSLTRRGDGDPGPLWDK